MRDGRYTMSCWEEVSLQMEKHNTSCYLPITFSYIVQADLKPLRGLGAGLVAKTLDTCVCQDRCSDPLNP